MRVGLVILGVVGFAAVAWRTLWALVRLLQRGADSLIAGGTVETRAHRGDITGMQEAASVRAQTARIRTRAAAFVLLWLVLLIAPTLTAAPELLYALYSPLWLLRNTRSPKLS